MNLKLIHDLSLSQLKAGWGKEVDGFFFGTFWYMNRGAEFAYNFVRETALKGGLKKAFGIPHHVIYIQGSDRPVEASAPKVGNKYFPRNPLWALREAVCLAPDVVQVFDLPLEEKDSEDVIVQKLTVNRDIVVQYDKWMKQHKLRSKDTMKNGLPRFSAFSLLGVAHGDYPGAYAEEAEFMAKYCEVVGVPVGGLTLKRQYKYIGKVLKAVLDVVSGRVIQLMGFGLSSVEKLTEIVKTAMQYDDATLWLESSTVVRNSAHGHKVLTLNPKTGKITYKAVAAIKDWKKSFKGKDIFEYNNKVLLGILNELQASLPTTR